MADDYDISALDLERLPRHVAIIMDGNGRWARRHGRPTIEGHEAGAESIRRVIEFCREVGVPALSLYAFSTENWRRDAHEVAGLFTLMSRYIHSELEELDKNNIRVQFMGRWQGLPEQAQADLRHCVEATAGNTTLCVNVAINYGGRAELVDAARQAMADAVAGVLKPEDFDEAAFAKRLYLPEHSEVDLLIRTSGEQRISNFMLWQISYAEIHTPEVLWPDFAKQDLADALAVYQSRQRRFGART